MSAETEIARLLRVHNATLVRRNKHLIYRLPSGRNFVVSFTPSDKRAALNSLRVLKRELGLASASASPSPSPKLKLHQPSVPPPPPTPTPTPLSSSSIPGTRRLSDILSSLPHARKV